MSGWRRGLAWQTSRPADLETVVPATARGSQRISGVLNPAKIDTPFAAHALRLTGLAWRHG